MKRLVKKAEGTAEVVAAVKACSDAITLICENLVDDYGAHAKDTVRKDQEYVTNDAITESLFEYFEEEAEERVDAIVGVFEDHYNEADLEFDRDQVITALINDSAFMSTVERTIAAYVAKCGFTNE